MGRPVGIQSALKPLKKLEKIEIKFYDHFRTIAESFKPTRPDPTWPDHNALWWLICQKVYKIGIWNFDKIFIQVFNLCYQSLESIYYIVWKLWDFPQRKSLLIFSSFFIITFDWNGNFEIRWFHRKDVVQIYQNILYLKFKNITYT